MGELGLSGVRRGGAKQRTAIADLSAARPAALEDRHFNSRRPDATWVGDGVCGVRDRRAIQSIELHITWEQEDDQMGAIALIFALMSILLIIGIVGTVIAITHLVYQSEDRDQHLIRDWDSRER